MYTLKVWKYGVIIEVYTTNDLKMLKDYYNDNWKWPEYDCDCFCDVEVAGRTLSILEKMDLMEK